MTEEKKTGLYQMINKAIQDQECMLCTVLEGVSQGEKALFCGGEKVWISGPDGLLSSMEEKLSERPGSGILETGDARIFCERFGGKNKLVICGAGHVSIPVIEISKKIGFYVTVVEDRPMFADHARMAGADEVICDSFEHGMDRIEGSNETYFVIVTRGHRYDTLCLEKAVNKNNAYIGMMGSHRRVALVKEQLEAKGIRRQLLEQVHTPIGLSIGAETPEEIAVSIMAEIIQEKNSKKRTIRICRRNSGCTAGRAGIFGNGRYRIKKRFCTEGNRDKDVDLPGWTYGGNYWRRLHGSRSYSESTADAVRVIAGASACSVGYDGERCGR